MTWRGVVALWRILETILTQAPMAFWEREFLFAPTIFGFHLKIVEALTKAPLGCIFSVAN
jgi:hypothetical protein